MAAPEVSRSRRAANSVRTESLEKLLEVRASIFLPGIAGRVDSEDGPEEPGLREEGLRGREAHDYCGTVVL